jgi:CBS-domain-containing membrane protein/ribosome-associated translation inhibitor RaiA
MNNTNKKIKDIMSKSPVTATVEDTLSALLNKMKDYHVREVPVIDEKDTLVGYVDYRTLARRKNISLYSRVINMIVHPSFLKEDDDVDLAIETMVNSGLRALPVVNNNKKLLGIVSMTDIISLLKDSNEFSDLSIQDIMTENPALLNKEQNIFDALNFMDRWDELSAPIADDEGKLVGMIHMSDITKIIWREKERLQYGTYKGEKDKIGIKIKDVMSDSVKCSKDASIKDVIKTLEQSKADMCIIVDRKNIPVGIITQKDILDQAYKSRNEKGVFVQITGFDSSDPEPYNIVYEMVEKFLNRINKYSMFKPQLMTFHVEVHKPEREEIKYSVRAKLQTDKKTFYYTDYDWNMYKLFKKVLDSLERNIRKEKERTEDQRIRVRGA